MGVYRRSDEWWGQFMFKRENNRVNLTSWSKETLKTKTEAGVVFERMKIAIRNRTFDPAGERPDPRDGFTMAAFWLVYKEKHLRNNKKAISRHVKIAEYFGETPMRSLTVNDLEDFFDSLREPAVFVPNWKHTLRARSAATRNRYRTNLRAWFNWALKRQSFGLTGTPFKHHGVNTIEWETEDRGRTRRLDPTEEDKLLANCSPLLWRLIIAALDTGMRRGELAALRFEDIYKEDGKLWLTVKGQHAKSGKTRYIPVSTQRLENVIAFQRRDGAGRRKPDSALVFSDESGLPIGSWRKAFELACARAELDGLNWHDFRHEYASRLVELGTPLPQVRDLLGHASVKTTERYDNQTKRAIAKSAAGLETFATPFSTDLAHAAGSPEDRRWKKGA